MKAKSITPMTKEIAENWCVKIETVLRIFPKGKFAVKANSSFERENVYGVSLTSVSMLREKWCDTEAECEAVLTHLISKPEKACSVFDL